MIGGLLVNAQLHSKEYEVVEPIKQLMLRAHGGEKQINKVKTMEYSVISISYGNVPPVSTRTIYRLDLKGKKITATTAHEGTTVVKTVDSTGAWHEVDGERTPLSEDDREQLERVYFLNLLAMLQNKDLSFEHIRTTQYKGHLTNVVLVTNPLQPLQHVNVYIAKNSGKVHALSWQKQSKENEVLYYVDLQEYNTIGKGLSYPLAYQMNINGELVSEGRIVDIKLNE